MVFLYPLEYVQSSNQQDDTHESTGNFTEVSTEMGCKEYTLFISVLFVSTLFKFACNVCILYLNNN